MLAVNHIPRDFNEKHNCCTKGQNVCRGCIFFSKWQHGLTSCSNGGATIARIYSCHDLDKGVSWTHTRVKYSRRRNCKKFHKKGKIYSGPVEHNTNLQNTTKSSQQCIGLIVLCCANSTVLRIALWQQQIHMYSYCHDLAATAWSKMKWSRLQTNSL